MLLDFVVAGVQKGGTKALDLVLRQQPGIRMAAIKEPHFFDNDNLDWGNPPYELYHSMFAESRENPTMYGEATPIYSYWPDALERLAGYNAEVRIVLLLRHPTFRAYSQWRMQLGRATEKVGFDRIVRVASLSGPKVRYNRPSRHGSYIERGFYSLQVRRMLRTFKREQLLFIRTDALWRDPNRVVSDIRTFLNLEQYQIPIQTRYVGNVIRLPISDGDRSALDRIYFDDIEETASLTKLDLSDWLSPCYSEPMNRLGSTHHRP